MLGQLLSVAYFIIIIFIDITGLQYYSDNQFIHYHHSDGITSIIIIIHREQGNSNEAYIINYLGMYVPP